MLVGPFVRLRDQAPGAILFVAAPSRVVSPECHVALAVGSGSCLC